MIKEAVSYEVGVVLMTDGSKMHITEYYDHIVTETGSVFLGNLVIKEIAAQVSQRCANIAHEVVMKTAQLGQVHEETT